MELLSNAPSAPKIYDDLEFRLKQPLNKNPALPKGNPSH